MKTTLIFPYIAFWVHSTKYCTISLSYCPETKVSQKGPPGTARAQPCVLHWHKKKQKPSILKKHQRILCKLYERKHCCLLTLFSPTSWANYSLACWKKNAPITAAIFKITFLTAYSSQQCANKTLLVSTTLIFPDYLKHDIAGYQISINITLLAEIQ